MEIVLTDDSLGEIPTPNSPFFFNSLPSAADQGLLTVQDWDLASIESTLSPAVFDPADAGGIEFDNWLEIDQSAVATEKFWPWNSTSITPISAEQFSSCHSFLCCSADSYLMENNYWPKLEQIKWNQQIAAQMSPMQKFQLRLQGIHRRLGHRQQRRKFSLKNGRGDEEKSAKNRRKNGANRIQVLKWREEFKKMC